MADATVTAWHVDTARTRAAVSGANGRYRFSGLAVGRYAVTAVLGGSQTSTVIADVNVGEGTVVDLRVENARAVEEVVVVRESTPAVDVTRSETTRVVTAGDLARLPLPRDPNAVVLMAPGAVYGDTAFGTGRNRDHYGSGFGYASLGGASVAENVYYINGMNVTNVRNGLGASTVPFEFYDQFQLKTGGFGAEFGRATGGVVNAVTKRGTNEWRFTVGGHAVPGSLRGHVPNIGHPSPRRSYDSVGGFDRKDEFDIFASAGGPVVRDRLLVYGIYDFRSVDERIHSAYGRVDRDVDDSGFWGLKVDWLFTDSHRIEYTGFSDARTADRTSFRWDPATGEVGDELRRTRYARGGVNHVAAYRGYFGTRLAASVLLGAGEYDLTNSSPGDADCPLVLDARSASSGVQGCWTGFSASTAADERTVARVDFEWALGDHLLSFGADREAKTSLDLVGFTGGGHYLYLDVTPGTVLPNGGTVPEGVTEATRYWRFVRGGDFDVTASAFYIEDEWLIASRNATLRLGLRNERFDNRNARGRSFLRMTDQFAPRVGLAWDPRGDGTSKLFANYGRYHLPVASIVNIRMAGSTLFTEDWYVLDGPVAANGSAPLETPIGDQVVHADGSPRDVRRVADRDLEPMAQDEIVLGYERQFLSDYVASVALTHRDLLHGIEDVTIDQALGVRGYNYVLANPGRAHPHVPRRGRRRHAGRDHAVRRRSRLPGRGASLHGADAGPQAALGRRLLLAGRLHPVAQPRQLRGNGAQRHGRRQRRLHDPVRLRRHAGRRGRRPAQRPSPHAARLGRLAVRPELAGERGVRVLLRPTPQRVRLPPDRLLRAAVRTIVLLPPGRAGAARFVGHDVRHVPTRRRSEVHARRAGGRRGRRSASTSSTSSTSTPRPRWTSTPTPGAVNRRPSSDFRSGSSSRERCASACGSASRAPAPGRGRTLPRRAFRPSAGLPMRSREERRPAVAGRRASRRSCARGSARRRG